MSGLKIFAIVLFALIIKANGSEHQRISKNFANIFLKTDLFNENNSHRSLECFAIYVPQLNELTGTYEIAYETCLNEAVNARSVIEEEMKKDRGDLENSVAQICETFRSCSTASTFPYDFFECYNNAGGEATTIAYNIQNIAKDKMEYIKMKYETIEYDKNRCTDECSRVYVEDSSKIYIDLEKCLAGISVDTTVAAPTITPLPTTEDPPEYPPIEEMHLIKF